MTDPQIALFMLGLFIFMVLLGFPIAFTLIAMGIFFGYYAYYDPFRMDHLFDNRICDLFVQNTFSVMSNDVLVAVPLFLFMGYVLERANIVNRLLFSIQLAARHLREGGLGLYDLSSSYFEGTTCPLAKRGYLLPYDSWSNRVATLRFVEDIPMSKEHPSYAELRAIEQALPLFKDKPMSILWGERDWCFTTKFASPAT